MRTSSAARQFVTWIPLAALLIVGIPLLASAAPSYAGPVDTQPVNWFAPSCAAAPAPRDGFLLPTLAVPAPGAGPRLVVTWNAMRGAMSEGLAHGVRQTQAASKPHKSWIGRNWWWFVPTVAVVGYTALYCAANCND